jgi:hypothetical protein
MTTVNYSPLRSESGFQSPGFEVSPTGKITTASGETQTFQDRVDINNELFVSEQIYINSIPLIDLSEPQINRLHPGITDSFLTKLATLRELSVVGNVDIEDQNNNKNISIINGTVLITSTNLGNIDNISIGLTTSANARFKDVEIGQPGTPSQLTVTGIVSISESATIPLLTTATGNITTTNSVTGNITTVNSNQVNSNQVNADEIDVDDIKINNQPTEIFHSTRKDYVDNRITALSIALGA